jgi:DNA-binding XRE family transcriptional regulator
MIDSQRFKEITDVIKLRKKTTIGKIAETIGVERHVLDNTRSGKQEPSIQLLRLIADCFPDFEEDLIPKIPILQDSQDQVGYGEMGILKETLSVQKELIAMQRLRIAQLEIENEKLKNKQT